MLTLLIRIQMTLPNYRSQLKGTLRVCRFPAMGSSGVCVMRNAPRLGGENELCVAHLCPLASWIGGEADAKVGVFGFSPVRCMRIFSILESARKCN